MTDLVLAQGITLAAFGNERGFDLRMAAGQRWLVSGASGAGKTCLVRTLLGLVSPRSGTVALDGIDLKAVSPQRLRSLRQTMGVVFSGGGLLPAWSALDNLVLPLRAISGLDEDAAEAAVLDFAQACALPAAWLQRPAAQLSAEQATLLALARALLIRPRLLWVDSALVWGLLAQARTQLGAQLAQQVEQGCTLVVCADALGVPAGQAPPCAGPSHWACLQDGWLECRQPPPNWNLEALLV